MTAYRTNRRPGLRELSGVGRELTDFTWRKACAAAGSGAGAISTRHQPKSAKTLNLQIPPVLATADEVIE